MAGFDFRRWRRSREISQQEVAAFCGCNVSTICRWEKGEISIKNYLLYMLENFIKEVEDEIH